MVLGRWRTKNIRVVDLLGRSDQAKIKVMKVIVQINIISVHC